MATTMYTINLELGMPTADTAIRILEGALARARAGQYKTVKIIHGYGSSGVGGRIKTQVGKHLTNAQKNGKIKAWCMGEEFDAFNSATQKMLSADYSLTKDRDYTRCNHGISMVLL